MRDHIYRMELFRSCQSSSFLASANRANVCEQFQEAIRVATNHSDWTCHVVLAMFGAEDDENFVEEVVLLEKE